MAVTPTYQTVGTSVAKPDAWLKAAGAAVYAGDVRVPGLLQARILRPPYPHARILGWDTSAAEALPGVAAVITGADIPAAARPRG